MTDKKFLYKNQDYYKIKKNCLENMELFYDDWFEHDVPDVTWLRPGKITRDPRFFVEGASRFDVVQGVSTNCWLVVAMANLTMNETLFHHVVPKDQTFSEGYYGVFRFNIWQCGKWVEVVVDDRLPTKHGKLIFSRSTKKNEFWSALLEKAFAKLYGSYNQLTAGWFCEGMVDLTGGMVERLDLLQTSLSFEKLESILRRSIEKNSFMCVFMLDNPTIKEEITPQGLVKGHAYSVTNVTNISYGKSNENIFLIRLRNPWGKVEWKGAWSDSSQEWKSIPDEEKEKIGLVSEKDGEFWLSLSDFLRNFQYIELCHLSPEVFSRIDLKENKIGWEANYFKGQWIKDVNSGGFDRETFHINPQYRITLTDTDDDEDKVSTVIIALMQKNKTRNIWYSINFTTFLLEGPEKLSQKCLSKDYIEKNFSNSKSSKFEKHREIVVRDTWQPGVYIIIPATRYPNQEGQFLLRVYSEKKILIEENEELPEKINGPSKLPNSMPGDKSVIPAGPIHTIREFQRPTRKPLLQKSDREIEEFFHKIADNENEIGWEKLQSLLDYALGNTTEQDLSSETDGGIISYCIEIILWLVSTFSGKRFESRKPNNINFTKDECRTMITLLDDDLSGKLGFREFQILWKKMYRWESVFLNYSKELDFMNVADLREALASSGYLVKSRDLGRMINRYSNGNSRLTFDDFVMCAIEIESI